MENNNFNNYNGDDYTTSFDPQDIEANKIISLFAYFGFLFFIPLLGAPNSKYARFHANQGLILFIVAFAYNMVSNIVRWSFGWGFWNEFFNPFSLVFNLIGLVLLIPMILGIYNAVTGKAKELPIIGKFRIIT